MASINALKAIEKFDIANGINRRYSMNIENVADIANNSTDICDAITKSFIFGYIQGTKAAKKEAERDNDS